MSFVAKNYVRLSRHFFRIKSIDFTKMLKSYKTILIHPVMEPGREVFSLPAIGSIIKHKGKDNVELLINENLRFFFNDTPSRKIYYKDFSSPFSYNYKELKEHLKQKSYDVFVELNRFNDDFLTMFAILPKSKIRICLDGSTENPIFNMVITTGELHNEIDRNNLILRPLGIKSVRKRIKWQRNLIMRKEKGKIGIAVHNHKIALKLFSLLKNRNLMPFLFVNDRNRVQRMKKMIGDTIMPIYPLEKVYDACSFCESIITSINPVLSIGFLQKKRMLLLLEKNEKFYPSSSSHHLEMLSLAQGTNSLFNKIKKFVRVK